jgi:predicted nucleic acid-binding protein
VRIARDTNILGYAESVNDPTRRDVVPDLLDALPTSTVVIPLQELGELFNVLVRKAGRSRSAASSALTSWRDAFATIPTTSEAMVAAVDLATVHQVSTWDGVILAAASQAGCRLLLSEDMQDGFTWGGVTVVNPFASPGHPLLDAVPGCRPRLKPVPPGIALFPVPSTVPVAYICTETAERSTARAKR